MEHLVGSGLYSLHQAARLVGEEPRTVRRWLRGYAWKAKDRRAHSEPLWRTAYDDDSLPGEKVISFRDLLELRMVARFARHGVSLQVIRATIQAAREDSNSAYPLSRRAFRTDGKRIFMNAIEQATGNVKMLDVLRKQFVFGEIIKASLFEGIVYDHDETPSRWYPVPKTHAVVLDPQVQFGTPILSDSGVPTDAIYAAWMAEGKDRHAVAREFEVAPDLVSAAVRFEQRLAA